MRSTISPEAGVKGARQRGRGPRDLRRIARFSEVVAVWARLRAYFEGPWAFAYSRCTSANL